MNIRTSQYLKHSLFCCCEHTSTPHPHNNNNNNNTRSLTVVINFRNKNKGYLLIFHQHVSFTSNLFTIISTISITSLSRGTLTSLPAQREREQWRGCWNNSLLETKKTICVSSYRYHHYNSNSIWTSDEIKFNTNNRHWQVIIFLEMLCFRLWYAMQER